jgi:3-oxoacyl-[acyl-carrier protein] reductase
MIDTALMGKVALITGVNNPNGIGAATARALAAQGAIVAGTYLAVPPHDSLVNAPGQDFYLAQRAKPPDEVVAAIRKQGGQIDVWETNLGDSSAIPRLFNQIENSFGSVDILVNNAAHCDPDTFIPSGQLADDSRAVDGFPLSTITAETHDSHFQVNSRAVALMMAEFARRHTEQGKRWGRIINVSTDGASGFKSEVSYGASKHALESYSRAAAQELGPYGITVNVVSLGPTQTGWITPEMEASISARTPMRRVGQPIDTADVIVFLASEQARWLTGQLIYVGGGWQMPL